MDIVIYMNEKDFLHKTDPEIYECYWEMKRFPKNFSWNDNIFFAMKGHVMGYVECIEFNPTKEMAETLVWDGSSFVYIKSIPCKQFRGFRYRWFEYEIEHNESQLKKRGSQNERCEGEED